MKNTIFIFSFFLISMISFGQIVTYSNIRQVRLKNAQAIIENKQVVGYYLFYFKDKANKKQNVYELSLLDVNLAPTHSIELIKSKNSGLLEVNYNGQVFCFSFLDMKERTIEYQIIDKSAKIVGSYIVDDISDSELARYAQMIQTEEDTYSGGQISAHGKGFIRYGVERKGGYRYEIEMIDNSAKKVWTTGLGATTKRSFETMQSFYCDDAMLITLVSSKEKSMSTESDNFLLFTNVDDGKEICRVSTEHEKGYLIPMGINYEDSKSAYFIYGEYYGRKGSNGQFDFENKLGFYTVIVDKTGKVIEEHFIDWKTDIAKLIPLNAKGRMEGNNSVFFHNIVRTADEKYFVIGEQYKKAANALGIAGKVVGGMSGMNSNVSTVKVELHDMIILEFDNSFKPIKVHHVEKDEARVPLPSGVGMLPVNYLGQYLKQNGAFDYSFTYVSEGSKTFNSTYVNYDKEKGEGKKYVIGNIVYKGGNIKIDRIPLTSKPTLFGIMPAKMGYIVIFEYFKKNKEFSVRLEKLDV